MLNFFLFCKKYFQTNGQGLVGRVSLGYLGEIRNTCLAKTLRPYDFIKLVCHDPDILPGREKAFLEAFKAFQSDVQARNMNAKVQKRTLKVAAWVEDNENIKKIVRDVLFVKLHVPTGPELNVNRLRWSVSLPGLAPMFLRDNWSERRQISLDRSVVLNLTFFVENGRLPDNLSSDDLNDLYTAARGLFGKKLKKECLEQMQTLEMLSENPLEIIDLALEQEDDLLFKHAARAFNALQRGIEISRSFQYP